MHVCSTWVLNRYGRNITVVLGCAVSARLITAALTVINKGLERMQLVAYRSNRCPALPIHMKMSNSMLAFCAVILALSFTGE